VKNKPLYKVLVNGRSCHGGDMEWSLPKKGKPGKWHSVNGQIRLCSNGLHLTDDPARWWSPGCSIYLVEARGVVGSCDDDSTRKVVCKSARLRRLATTKELDTLRIWSSGEHEIHDLPCVLSGSATVTAYGSATVTAYGSATVSAEAQSTVISWRGRDGIKIVEHAVCIVRSWTTDPITLTART
jgi:hypothetical protein